MNLLTAPNGTELEITQKFVESHREEIKAMLIARSTDLWCVYVYLQVALRHALNIRNPEMDFHTQYQKLLNEYQFLCVLLNRSLEAESPVSTDAKGNMLITGAVHIQASLSGRIVNGVHI